MICKKCDGRGKTTEYDGLRKFWCDYKCEYCNGTGEVEMTNEEWLRSCPPQELIRFLMNVAYGGQRRNVQKRTFDEEAEKWCEWLKEIHE